MAPPVNPYDTLNVGGTGVGVSVLVGAATTTVGVGLGVVFKRTGGKSPKMNVYPLAVGGTGNPKHHHEVSVRPICGRAP
jgi:hypothetical protein